MKEKFSLKDHLFNEESVTYLATLLEKGVPHFKKRTFISSILEGFPERELKERITWVTEKLEQQLPRDYPEAISFLIQSLPEPLNPENTDNDFGDFIFAPLGEYVMRNGVEKKHLSLSLKTLKVFTQYFSMEFAMRSFINEFPEKTFQTLSLWATDSNYHVRRLVSESSRPKLPWAPKIHMVHSKPIPLLTTLHKDKTRYVTRSVANHMNDISKIDASLVLKTLKLWKRLKEQDEKELDYIINHSLRTLIKQGDREAMLFLGYNPKPNVDLTNFKLSPEKAAIGDVLDFSFILQSPRKTSCIVDYILTSPKKLRKRGSKVYKIKKLILSPNTPTIFTKRHKLHKTATTYTLLPGKYTLSIQINGKILHEHNFHVT